MSGTSVDLYLAAEDFESADVVVQRYSFGPGVRISIGHDAIVIRSGEGDSPEAFGAALRGLAARIDAGILDLRWPDRGRVPTEVEA